jgi:hypothetical protein
MSKETNPGESVDQDTPEVLLSLAAFSSEAQARRLRYVESLDAMQKLAERLLNVELKITGTIRVHDDDGPLSPGFAYHEPYTYKNVENLSVMVRLARVVDHDTELPGQNLPYIHIVGRKVDTSEFVGIDLGVIENFVQAEVVEPQTAQA